MTGSLRSLPVRSDADLIQVVLAVRVRALRQRLPIRVRQEHA
jgi:hypothetical protein